MTRLATDPVASLPQAPSAQRGALGTLLRRPAAIVAIAYLAILVVVSVAAPLIAPADPLGLDLARVLSGPTQNNLLGTDSLGRDVLSRILYGGRRSLISVVEGVVVVLAIGVPLGLAAGYFRGWGDSVISRISDVLLAVPGIILVLVILAVVPRNEDVAMVAFAVLGAPSVFRVVRGATLRVREELYIAAARVSGLSHPRIVMRHVLPRITGPVVVQASLFAAYALLFETGIAYLGLAADPSTPTWGGMVGEASTVIQQQQWLVIPSGVTIAVTILAFGLLGDSLRDALAVDERIASSAARGGKRAPAPVVVENASEPASSREGALLDVRNMSVSVLSEDGVTPVVEGVSFDVMPGETVGLIGESGCGKSVTAYAILRLLPPELVLASGQVFLDGTDIAAASDRDFDRLRGRTLAYVSQEPQPSLDPTFTVGSQLSEVVRNHEGGTRREAKQRALELLELVELPGAQQVARARAHELSGGMAQRVAIAIALAGRPKLLIADEPTTALDVTIQAEILALLRRLKAETGLAMLLITHNWGVVADTCDRTVVMYAGQVVERADVQDLFDRPLHPYTRGLLESEPALAEPGDPLAAMPGSVPAPGSWSSGCRFAARCPFAVAECSDGAVPLAPVGTGRQSRCLRVDEIFGAVTA